MACKNLLETTPIAERRLMTIRLWSCFTNWVAMMFRLAAPWDWAKSQTRNIHAKPRPIPLHIASEEQKDKILLRQSENLRMKQAGGPDRLFLHQDLTPKQREACCRLVAELRDRTTEKTISWLSMGKLCNGGADMQRHRRRGRQSSLCQHKRQ